MCKAVEFRSKTFQISLFSSEDAIVSSFIAEAPVVNIVPFADTLVHTKIPIPSKDEEN